MQADVAALDKGVGRDSKPSNQALICRQVWHASLFDPRESRRRDLCLEGSLAQAQALPLAPFPEHPAQGLDIERFVRHATEYRAVVALERQTGASGSIVAASGPVLGRSRELRRRC